MKREEAIKVIKEAMPTLWKETKDAIQTLIPELAENEDERIRKALIEVFKKKLERGFEWVEYGIPNRSVLDWLEKQKEQKPTESISQLTVQGKGVYKICPRCKERMVRDDSMVYTSMPPQYIYECPKCGERECDTVMYDSSVDEKQQEQKPILSDRDLTDFEIEVHEIIAQARNDSRLNDADVLKQFEEEAAFTLMLKANKLIEQKPAATINSEPIPTENHSVDIPLAEWSEEDEARIERIAAFMWRNRKGDTDDIFLQEQDVAWLKSLRPQPKKELSIEKAIQWLDDTFYFLDNSSGRGRDCEITTHDFDSLEEMYDSFRKAVIIDSEPHWKPSKEQME